MTILLSILAFLIIFSALVLVHEFGHYIAARKSGVYVKEFGFGLPPRLWGKETSRWVTYKDKSGKKIRRKEKMIWSLNWIPFGGFVRMLGEDDTSKEIKNDPRAFFNRPLGSRILIVVAGVLMNFLMAWVLLTIAFSIGAQPLLINEKEAKNYLETGVMERSNGVVLESITPEIKEKAELEAGDIILSINNKEVNSPKEITSLLETANLTNDAIELKIKRISEEEDLLFTTNIAIGSGEKLGTLYPIPPIEKVNNLKLPVHKAGFYSLVKIGKFSVLTVEAFGKTIGKIIRTASPPDNVSGPVGIARLTHQFVQLGDIMTLILFTAMISISLAVLNIMPLPALDGGRLMFLLFELFTGKKPSVKWEAMIHGIGFALLLALIAVVTYSDILKIFNK